MNPARRFVLAAAVLLATAPAVPHAASAPTPPSEVLGRVLDSHGRPVPDAEVRFTVTSESPLFWELPREERKRAQRARSDADGTFHVDGLQPGTPYDVVVVRRGYAALLTSFSLREEGPTPELRLVLTRGTAARGRVLDGHGQPVEGAEVRLERSQRTGIRAMDTGSTIWADRGVYRALTGPDGRFEVADLPEHEFDLEIRAAGFSPFSQTGFRLSGALEAVEIGSFRLHPGAAAEVRVTDPQGRPIQGVAVWLRDSDADAPVAESGPDGRFVLRDLDPEERLSLSVCRPGFLSESVSPAVSAPEVARVVLEPAARLAGRVVTAEGAPVPRRGSLRLFEHR